MKASELIKKLKAIKVPFDAELTDREFSPFVQNLISITHGVPFIVLRFGDGNAILTSQAISILEELCSDAPFYPTITNARLGENHLELQKVYNEPPVTILAFNK